LRKQMSGQAFIPHALSRPRPRMGNHAGIYAKFAGTPSFTTTLGGIHWPTEGRNALQ